MGFLEVLREVLSLSTTVGNLSSELRQTANIVEENRERVIKLENSKDLIAEQAKSTSLQAIMSSNHLLFSRNQELEAKVIELQKRIETMESLIGANQKSGANLSLAAKNDTANKQFPNS